MPGRTPYEAVTNFVAPLQRAASCITQTPFIISSGGRHDLGKVHSLTWSTGEPVMVEREGGEILLLDLALNYEIISIPDDTVRGPYKVSTRGYMHSLQTVDDAEIIAFHWHPVGDSDVKDPHTHIGTTQLSETGVLTKKHHLPGRRMSVEEVIVFCVDQFKLKPIRSDWRQILADSHDIFRMFATWGSDSTPEAKEPIR